jgi:hypothetical protein
MPLDVKVCNMNITSYDLDYQLNIGV